MSDRMKPKATHSILNDEIGIRKPRAPLAIKRAVLAVVFLVAVWMSFSSGRESLRSFVRDMIAEVDPTLADPCYANFDKVKDGMKRSEVHALMGWPPTTAVCWSGMFYVDEWNGTRGTVRVQYGPKWRPLDKRQFVTRKDICN